VNNQKIKRDYIWTLQVNVTLKCTFCKGENFPHYALEKDIDLKYFEKMITAFVNADFISLSGPSGNPLCSKNLLNILDLVKQHRGKS